MAFKEESKKAVLRRPRQKTRRLPFNFSTSPPDLPTALARYIMETSQDRLESHDEAIELGLEPGMLQYTEYINDTTTRQLDFEEVILLLQGQKGLDRLATMLKMRRVQVKHGDVRREKNVLQGYCVKCKTWIHEKEWKRHRRHHA